MTDIPPADEVLTGLDFVPPRPPHRKQTRMTTTDTDALRHVKGEG